MNIIFFIETNCNGLAFIFRFVMHFAPDNYDAKRFGLDKMKIIFYLIKWPSFCHLYCRI